MILVIGEILYDLFPSYKRIGGAPFNFAFHLKQLGAEVRFISRVGRDDLGNEILEFITSKGFDPRDIQRDDDAPTGRVEVSMTPEGGHSFSIVKNTAYDRIDFNHRLKALCTAGPDLFYFGTLVQRTPNGNRLIRSVIESLPPETQTFCDVNLRPDAWTLPLVTECVAKADFLKLSQEELDILVPDTTLSIEDRAKTLLADPGPERIILTRGEKGSLWVSSKGLVPSPATRPLKPVDTVGAGDAYAAMAVAARLRGLGDHKAIALAHEFAAGICEIQGALPSDPLFYSPFLTRLNHDN